MAITLDKLKRPTGKGTPPAPAETSNNLVKPPAGKTVPCKSISTRKPSANFVSTPQNTTST